MEVRACEFKPPCCSNSKGVAEAGALCEQRAIWFADVVGQRAVQRSSDAGYPQNDQAITTLVNNDLRA